MNIESLTYILLSLSSLSPMKKDISSAIDHDDLRKKFNKYTKKAFKMLPKLEKPQILDIGCGSGVPTLELATLCDGQITGIDINRVLLDKFTKKIKAAGLTDRVKAMECSMHNITFPDEYFDFIWAEGSIFMIGFQQGLKEWHRFIKPGGFLVIHDEMGDLSEKLKYLFSSDYKLIEYFEISGNIWLNEFYNPYEKRIHKLRVEYKDDTEALSFLDKEQLEIDKFKKNPSLHGSVFFIMQKH